MDLTVGLKGKDYSGLDFIYGAYGYGNIGDESCLIGTLAKYGKSNKVVFSASPTQTRGMCGIETIGGFTYDANALILGGGLLLRDPETPPSLVFSLIEHYLRERKDIKMAALGVDGKLSKEYVSLLNRLTYIAVRLEADKDILVGKGVTSEIIVEEDPSCYVGFNREFGKEILGKYYDVSKKMLGINIARLDSPTMPVHYDEVALLLREIIKEYCEFEVVPIVHCIHKHAQFERDDIYLSKAFTDLGVDFNPEFMQTLHSPFEMKSIISNIDFVVSMRKHTLYSSLQSNACAERLAIVSVVCPDNEVSRMAIEKKIEIVYA